MLAGDTGEAFEAAEAGDVAAAAFDSDWSGFLITDLNGNVMTADVEEMAASATGFGQADSLATTSVSLYDIAISSTGRVLGVTNGVDGTSTLYEFSVDFDSPGGYSVPVLIGFVATNEMGVRLNGLEFAPDDTLLASGLDFDGLPWGNYLYSIDTNSAAATQLVNTGSHESAGDVAVDEEGAVYLTSLTGNLLHIPSDYSGYSVVGNVGFSDVYGMTYGPGPNLRGYRSNWDVLNIDPNDATWYLEGTLFAGPTVSTPGAVLGASSLYDPPTDLGEVDYVELTGQSPILEQLWYRFDTMHDGYVTVELDDLGSTGGLEMTLHREDTDGELELISTGTTRVDDVTPEAGGRYFVEITGLRSEASVRVVNLVEPGTDTLTVHGSDESDELVLEIGSPYLVDINGVDYEVTFPEAALVTTTFDAGDGGDLIRVVGGDDDDTADIDMATRSGTITGPGFEVNFSSTIVMEFDGQDGHDTAAILGTDVDSELQLAPFQGALLEGLVQGTVLNAEEITIDAAGGDDHVVFEGGSKEDRLDLNPTSGLYREYVPTGELRDPTFMISADNIESNFATSGGGVDRVFMRDTAGDEVFTAGLGLVTYEGPGYSHEIRGFREVHAYGLNGGDDQATIYDTPDNDKFKGKEDFGNLRGGGFYFRAKGFESISATALYGGDDYAVLFDTGGDDLLTASYETATMTSATLIRQATGFEEVLGRASSGYDIARLEDSPGDDELRSRSHKSVFRSLDDDALHVTVRAFDEVYAEAVHGGDDIGKMHDTAGDDELSGTGDTARLSWDDAGSLDLLYEMMAFETIKVYWTTGTNTDNTVLPIDYTLIFA